MEVVKSAFFSLQVTVTFKVTVTLLFYSFRYDLFQQEGFLAIDTLRFAFIGNDQQAFAFGAGHGKRFLPRSEITIRIIDTTKEGASLARFAFHQFAAIGWDMQRRSSRATARYNDNQGSRCMK